MDFKNPSHKSKLGRNQEIVGGNCPNTKTPRPTMQKLEVGFCNGITTPEHANSWFIHCFFVALQYCGLGGYSNIYDHFFLSWKIERETSNEWELDDKCLEIVDHDTISMTGDMDSPKFSSLFLFVGYHDYPCILHQNLNTSISKFLNSSTLNESWIYIWLNVYGL